MYGVYLNGELMVSFDTAEEAFQAAEFATEETGVFHEVKKEKVNSLNELIGAQIKSMDESSIYVELDGETHRLEIISRGAGCCGYADFAINLLYSENDIRNPIITNVSKSEEKDTYNESSVITFYGESKKLAEVEGEAGSESGYEYGAYVTLMCKTLDIEEDLANW